MPPRDDRVLPLTKAVAILVIPVLVAAVVILCLQPERASEVFAWPIKPQLTGMLLGIRRTSVEWSSSAWSWAPDAGMRWLSAFPRWPCSPRSSC